MSDRPNPERIDAIVPRVMEQLCTQLTRPHALEVMLLAYLALDRDCLRGRTKPQLSQPARRIVSYLRETSPTMPFCAEDVCVHYANLSDTKLAAVIALARDVEQVTLAELSFLPCDTVLRCLGSLPKSSAGDRILEAAEASAA